MERRRQRHPSCRPLVLGSEGHADTSELYGTLLKCCGSTRRLSTTVDDWLDAERELRGATTSAAA
jgi:hypothetical protein